MYEKGSECVHVDEHIQQCKQIRTPVEGGPPRGEEGELRGGHIVGGGAHRDGVLCLRGRAHRPWQKKR